MARGSVFLIFLYFSIASSAHTQIRSGSRLVTHLCVIHPFPGLCDINFKEVYVSPVRPLPYYEGNQWLRLSILSLQTRHVL